MLNSWRIVTGICLLAIAACGCDDRDADTVRVYQAPKEVAAAPVDVPAPGNQPVAGAPQWTVPQGWAQQPPGNMEFAKYQVDAADPSLNAVVTVLAANPQSSDLLFEVNRWEGQLGTPPSKADTLTKVATHLQNGGNEIDYVDLKGPPKAGQSEETRMLAAMIPQSGQLWFVKLVGPASKVAPHKAEYDAFLKSLSFATPSPMAATQEAGAANPTSTAIPGFKSYIAPDGWVFDPQPRQMRIGTFHISGGGEQAEVIISLLNANNFGTPEGNMTRWRGQVGLDPVDDPNTVPHVPITIDGATGFMVDLVSPAGNLKPQQLVVVQLIKGPRAFFFKLIGPSKLVEDQKKAFNAFLQSIQFAVE